MSEIGEAVGTAAEGALFARAIEPQRSGGRPEVRDGHFAENACLNCGAPLATPYCSQCGQAAHLHRDLKAFFHDLLHGALHFEGKIFRTLPLLAFRPGALTRRYIEGERARFVSPMALFLFSVFLMFAVFQVVGLTPPSEFSSGIELNENGDADPAEALAGLRTARSHIADNNPGAVALDMQIEVLERELAEAGTETPAEEPAETGDKAVLVQSGDGKAKLTTTRTGSSFLDHGIEKWRENPGLMAYKLQANSYKFSWLLIPLSIPFVWLIFAWRRRFGAYDHAVFVTYSLSFMTLFFVMLTLLGMIGLGEGALFFAATLAPLLHIYKQLKGAYALSRFSALWRTAVLAGFILLILMLFLNLLLLLGMAG